MATKAQLDAARTNIKKAQQASRTKHTIVHLPEGTRREIGQHATIGLTRHSKSSRALEERNSQQLYALASEHRVPGRAKMGKTELIAAIRKVR
jgi:Rho termination factor, N-terminal domain